MVRAPHEPTPQAAVPRLVERLVNACQPEYIYLFGSRARGDSSDESDYDFMVVLPDDAPEELFSGQVKAQAVRGLDLNSSTDIKLMHRSDFERQLHLRGSMPSAVLRDGQCLYARTGAFALSPTQSRTEGRLVREPQAGDDEYDAVLVENTRDWIRVTRNDLRLAEFALGEDMFAESLFHSQQAVEKAMKTVLTWNDEPVPKKHDLAALGAVCAECAVLMEPYLEAASRLSEWAIDGRYPPPKANRELATAGLQLARQAVEALFEGIPAAVRDS